MPSSLNQCQFIGNLGKDPEIRYKPDGKAVVNISLGVSDSWKDKNTGQRQEKTEWVKIVFFDGIASIAGEYLKKGSKIYVSGKQRTRKWQNQQGQDQYTTEVVVDGFSGTMQMLDSNNSGGGTAPANNSQQQQNYQQPQQPYPAGQPFEDEFSDDIPF